MVARPTTWTVAALFLALSAMSNAAAACVTAPEFASYGPPADMATDPVRPDRLGRIVAPISVNGQGPFRFVVDTGANRSAIAERLAGQLGLPSTGSGAVHSVYGVSPAPLVRVDRLHYGALSLRSDEMPVLRGDMLAGEHGLLGVDGMAGRRLLIDFERNCIEIAQSRGAPRLHRWIELRGQMRFGHLVVVDGEVSGVPVKLFLDTGSDATLANEALTEAIAARVGRGLPPHESAVAYSAGRPVVLDRAILIPRVSIGPVHANNVTAYVGDFHIFSIWQLTDEPTLLIGMDVLSQASGLAIDYGRAMIHVRVRTSARPRIGARRANS